eukprot:403375686
MEDLTQQKQSIKNQNGIQRQRSLVKPVIEQITSDEELQQVFQAQQKGKSSDQIRFLDSSQTQQKTVKDRNNQINNQHLNYPSKSIENYDMRNSNIPLSSLNDLNGQSENNDDSQNEEERHLLKLVAQESLDELRLFLQGISIDLTVIWDQNGFNLLHLAAFKNSLSIIQVLCHYVVEEEALKLDNQQFRSVEYHREQTFQVQQFQSPHQKVAQWIEQYAKGQDESFTPLHFAAFNGNIDMLTYFLTMGANILSVHQHSKSQVSLIHVAAQGDNPNILAFLKQHLQTQDQNIVSKRDIKYATPLHWACYSGAESSVHYLLAWGANPNTQDLTGITPLHLAVKSSEEIRSTRLVRMLLIKGAQRDIIDSYGRKPIDIAQDCIIPNIQKELLQILAEPNLMQKCMIQTPMQKTKSSQASVIAFMVLYGMSFLYLLLNTLQDTGISVNLKFTLAANFLITTVFFFLSWLKNPGYLEKSQRLDFLALVLKYDSFALCPECSLIKTERSKHCNICNRCVSRYDHHCPWINNCVGINNHGYFYIYILSLLIYMVSVFFVLFQSLRNEFQGKLTLQSIRQQDFSQVIQEILFNNQSNIGYSHTIQITSEIILLVICLVFMIPLVILVSIQTKNIISNETTSERFSKRKEAQGQSQQSDNQNNKENQNMQSNTALDILPGDLLQQTTSLIPNQGQSSSQVQGENKEGVHNQNQNSKSQNKTLDYILKMVHNVFLMFCQQDQVSQEQLYVGKK